MSRMRNKIKKIISGGQSGTDRAVLDFALRNKIPCGGWCPHGRMAEDGRIPERYPLQESQEEDPAHRTVKNVNISDGTLIIYLNVMDEGTRFTLDHAKELRKPVYLIKEADQVNKEEFNTWLEVNRIKTLNIAGPRESNEPGIYDFSVKTLKTLFYQ